MNPSGTVVPISILHYVPSGSRVDGTVDYTATVNTPGGVGDDVMTVTEDAWYDERDPSAPQTLPRAVCFADTGCSAGVTTKQQLFLSDPRTMTASDIPVFSVRQLSNKSWVGTLSKLGSSNAADTTSMIMDKNNVDPNQAINFSIVSSEWGTGPGTNVWMTAKANITGGDSALHYTITGTSSVSVPSVSVIPRIYKQTPAGDVLVFTGAAQTCPSGTTCTVRGYFIPVWDVSNITSMFFANTTVVFTLPSAGVGAGGLTNVGLQPPETSSAPTVQEVVVAEPLVPQKPGAVNSPDGTAIPWNGTVEHTQENGKAVTVVFDHDGLPVSWAEDDKSTKIAVPGNRLLPATEVFIVPSEAVVNQSSLQNIVVTDPTSWIR